MHRPSFPARPAQTPPIDEQQLANDFASVLTDDDLDIGVTHQKRVHDASKPALTKFTTFMAGRAGLFWCAMSTALVAISYSSICTFVFLVVFSAIVISWAFHIDVLHPKMNTSRCLWFVGIYRIFVTVYLIVLVCFQLPWLVRWHSPQHETVSSVLQFIGLVPINTAEPGGWTAVTAFGAAVATYLFTGMFETALRALQKANDYAKEHRSGESGSASPTATIEEDVQVAVPEPARRPSYYELQLLLFLRHASSLGLLTWALVFPGILTLPLLFAAILYLSLKNYRKSRLFDYLIVYALVLQMAHYLLIAVTDAFRSGDDDSPILQLLGLQSLQAQFSVNLIESIALGLLCMNLFSRRYIASVQSTPDRNATGDVAGSMEIREFVQMSLFSSRSRKRDSLYSPLKLCIDQLALASLYVAGGMDLSALNAVFLVALSALCILQSFGLFRRPKIFSVVWSVVLVYSILFLLTTGTFCRAVDSIWECNVDNVGLKMASTGQVVAYAATVVLASIQVNFTWSNISVEEGNLKEFEGRFWGILRKYFLYAAYAALLFYPLLFRANFLSYGYVIFLFLTIVVELLPTSLRGQRSDVRRFVKKYWILVILFACVAMLSRYFVSLHWTSNAKARRWFFGLESGDSRRTFVITLGDAIVLIVMSLQGRMFVVDYIADAHNAERNSKFSAEGSSEHAAGMADNRDTLSEPGELGTTTENLEPMTVPRHRRYKSMEEYLTYEFSTEPISLVQESQPKTVSRGLSRHQTIHRFSVGRRSGSEDSGSVRTPDSEVIRKLEEDERRKTELEQVLNRARIEQALDMFRNFRKSVPVKQTEKFLHDAYAVGALLLRNGMLKYSYVLEAAAILAASVWLPDVSVFGAVYIFLGCIVLLAEQPSFKKQKDESQSRSGQRIAKSMPTLLLILSFSLMSAQYIFLIVYFIVDFMDESVTVYLGLQEPANMESLPITVEAMLAHVLVFVTAIVQKIAVRWAKIDAELIEGAERDAFEFRSRLDDRVQSTHALDTAVPIGSVIKGVGGSSSRPTLDISAAPSSLMTAYPANWSETLTWRPSHLRHVAVNDSTESDTSERTLNSQFLGSLKGSEQDKIEQLRGKVFDVLKSVYTRVRAVLSLLNPFWKDWGSDVTFMYLVICGAITETVFSVLYVGIVLAISGFRRCKVQRHWHQVTLLLVVLVLMQYLLTLGLPAEKNAPNASEPLDAWRVWLLLERERNSTERKLAITFAFIAVICAGITLNSISEGSRTLLYWFNRLHSGELDPARSDTLSQHYGQDLELNQPLETPQMQDESRRVQKSFSPVQGTDPRGPKPGNGFVPRVADHTRERHDTPPSLTSFISGLGQTGVGRVHDFDEFSGFERTSFEPLSTTGDEETATGDSQLLKSYDDKQGRKERLPRVDRDYFPIPGGSAVEASEGSSKDIERQILRPNDPEDFTRRPIAFQNLVKLTWMRFMGALVQLYVFAVATVDTNVMSAVLLMVAFSFLFQFTNVSAKKKRFKFLRGYVMLVIFALVTFQAPFGTPSDGGWEDIVGLYKDDTNRGETLLYLMVSLWILCQIQVRIYESGDFHYVEKYGQEDAKVRFKRAVHEHNSRKYEKLLDRNKAERSHYARKARLTRLKSLKESEKTVDAFYNVCVVHEIEFIRKQAAAESSENTSAFKSHRLIEVSEKDENLPRGLEKLARRLLRGKRWKKYCTQTLSSEATSFVFRYSAWPVYATMVLAAIMNPSITTIAYPLAVFLYLIVEQPRPPKHAWTVLLVYVCCAIAFKYVFRSKSIPFCESDVPFFALGGNGNGSEASVRNLNDCAPAAGIGFDIFILLALLGHRAVLYSRGVWDLVMSEENMLLRSEIRGHELDTIPEMSYVMESQSESEHEKDSSSVLRAGMNHVEHLWSAEQQCDDVEHILSKARRDIIEDVRDQTDLTEKVKTPSPIGPRRAAVTTGSRPPRPSLAIPVSSMHGVTGQTPRIEKEGTPSGLRRRQAVARRPQNNDEGWNRPPQHSGTGRGKTIPKSAPPPTSMMRNSNPRSSPSIQGSDASRRHPNLSRFRSFRVGVNRAYDPLPTPGPMTSGQSRVQESLKQAKIIPEYKTPGRGRSLSLFHVEQKGMLSFLRQYFVRLTRENDHKAIGDYYLLIFIADFISFVYVMFGFSAIFGDSNSGRRETWWTTNFIETRHLLTLLVMFTMIILDRICYLTRSMTGKLILQYSSVIVYHVVLFILQDHIGERIATRIFYILRCVYFLLSGLQIRDGFPMYTTAQFLLRNYTTLGIVLFEIYIFVPFLWLSRTLLDWAVLPTSLEIFQYFRFIDIYLWLYRNRAVNTSRGRFRRKLGEKRRLLPRVYQGFGLFLLCVIALFLPFIIFSIFNPFFVSRELSSATVNVNLVTFENTSTFGGRTYEVYSRTSTVGKPLQQNESSAAEKAVGVTLDVREREKVFEAWFSAISGSTWQLAAEDRDDLVKSLQQFSSGNYTGLPPLLDFSLAATTQDRNTFGTKRLYHTYNLNRTEARDIASALSDERGFALKILSPLPRYSVLQSGAVVFESYRGQQGRGDVCIRFIEPGTVPNLGLSFWTMSDCTKESCVCSNTASFDDTNSQRRHLLQIADISALQVGGATILTLYTAILFTIANLLKRMFIDKRLIIPYIDMPYTLHLYQLVLDIMYARQDHQLEMEEILYNGLIDIYRDQRELARWTGERALKLPAAWWDRSEVDNPFMVYPSFSETASEPYVDRIVE